MHARREPTPPYALVQSAVQVARPDLPTTSRAGRRIAFFLHSLEMGGAQKMTLRLAGGLARAGYSVDIVVAQADGPLLNEVSPEVGLVVLPLAPRRRAGGRAARVRAAIPALARYVRERRPAALIAGANHVSIATVLARVVAREPDTRLILRATNPVWRPGGSRLKRAVARLLFPRADLVIAVSEPVAADHAGALGARVPVEVIPEPAIAADFGERLAAPPFHPWIEDGAELVVSIGRLVRQKDHRALIEAFVAVRALRPTARLLIVGDGPLKTELIELRHRLGLDKVIAFAGAVDNPLPALRRARCFAMPSAWEGLGIAAIEAVAAGCPVVAVDSPAVRWALRNGTLGRLVPAGDRAVLAAAIADQVRQSAHRRPAAVRALDFTLEAAVRRYGAALDRLCGAS